MAVTSLPIRLPESLIGAFIDNRDSIFSYHADELLLKRDVVDVNDDEPSYSRSRSSRSRSSVSSSRSSRSKSSRNSRSKRGKSKNSRQERNHQERRYTLGDCSSPRNNREEAQEAEQDFGQQHSCRKEDQSEIKKIYILKPTPRIVGFSNTSLIIL